ncbi:MAG: hypothetical protein J3R72DRAFT_499264 [Linnemannia gamsii]|nr:MAG: hypothetical protein J3R72DRAFT_499264 [Linnemannia gamsii]
MADTSSSSSPGQHTNRALLIIELLERIGSHLTPPDLLACVQVSRHWNSVLIPCLWHTIDDSLYSWSDIIAVHIDNNAPRLSRIIKAEREAEQAASNSNSGTDGPPLDEEKALGQRVIEAWPSRRAETLCWIYGVFKKYGRHVRTLRVCWPIVIRVAGVAGHCTHLRVLTAHPNPQRDSLPKIVSGGALDQQRDRDEQKWMNIYEEPTADWQGFWQCIDDDEQEARLWSTGLRLADDDVPTWLYWAAARRFWILVLRNPTIEYLRLSRILCTISPLVSEKFVYHVLATLPRLKCLDSHFMALDLQTVLECTSTTHSGNSNRGLFYHDNKPRSLRLDRDFAHMTSLAVRGGFVKPTDILMLLKRLVNLNQLTVGKINLDDGTQQLFVDTDDNYEERTRKFPLSGLHLVDFSEVTDGFMAVREAITKRLIPRLPFLTEISDEVLMPEMVRALASQCRQLRSFRKNCNHDGIYREADALDTKLNVVNILLESCPNLTTIDAIQHRIDANYLLKHPWVCEGTLETFRCQIVMDRMTPDDCRAMSLEQGDSSRSIAEEKYRRCQEQHSRVYGRLARLTHLQTLDLGGNIQDWRNQFYEETPVIELNGRMFLFLSTPIMDGLELSLASGLGQLASLKDLRVFGFEGHDHRIENAELEWIAGHWPKLTVMRGLHIDKSPTLAKVDLKTAEQRAYMQTLRPSLIHKAADLPHQSALWSDRNLKNCDEKKFEAASYRCYSLDARRVFSALRNKFCTPRGNLGDENLAALRILEESKASTTTDRIELRIVPMCTSSQYCLFSVQRQFFN